MKEKLKKNKGITLIALVITIIVLLILAGVTLSTLFGKNGILTESKLAVESNKEANAKEQVQLAWTACETEYQSAWTKDSSVVKKNYFDPDDLNRNLGTGEVKSVGYVENGKSTVTYTLDETEYEFEITNGQVYKVGQAPDVTNPNVISGNLAKIIEPISYGDYIDYNVELNGDSNTSNDWKIFYNDGENVFIIASECLPTDKIPDISTMVKNGKNVNWDYDKTNKNAGASGIDSNIARKFQLSWLFEGSNGNSTYMNIKKVQDLMDTNKWSTFATGVSGAQAIGGPTLEMWINSRNAKYPEEPLIFNNGGTTNSDGNIYEYDGPIISMGSHESGYTIGGKMKNEEGEEFWSRLGSSVDFIWDDDYSQSWYDGYSSIELNYPLGSQDPLFRTNDYYWIASPNPTIDNGCNYGDTSKTWGEGDEPFSVYCTVGTSLWGEPRCARWDNGKGIRPVVCLPSGVNATKVDGIWRID